MTLRYVGSGGSDSNNGLSWANRKLTLNGVEDSPVAAGDIVYVGPGVYRETLTLDVSGSSGNPIAYVGDYTGANTDGVGGTVRITGSDNDTTQTRTTGITATSRNYRTFTGFEFGLVSTAAINMATACGNWIIENCAFSQMTGDAIVMAGTGVANTIRRCYFTPLKGIAVKVSHSSVVNDTGHVIENCLFLGVNGGGIRNERVGGILVRNCSFLGVGTHAIRILTALNSGQVITVNNCIFSGCLNVLTATTTAEFVEDYNALFGNTTDRTNVTAGSNSNAYPPLLDNRWFFEMVGG